MRRYPWQLLRMIGLAALCLLCANSAIRAASLTLTPATVSIPPSSQRTFQATASGLGGDTLRWFVDGIEGGNANVGTINAATGVYTAPGQVGLSVTLSVTGTANPGVGASAQITVRNRVPWITGTSPASLPTGPYTLTVSGDRYVNGAQAFINGVPVTTAFVSDKQLTLTGSVAPGQTGTLTLTVANPGPVLSAPYLNLSVANTSAVPPLLPGAPADPATVAAARFLEQASFGPTAADLAWVKAQGMHAWLDRQFDPALTPSSTLPDGLSVGETEARFFANLAGGGDALRQRMAFALSQILVISAEKNTNGDELIPYARLLYQHAFGNYADLLHDLTLSASMGKYLDMVNSTRPTANNQNAANENYARELLQLFSIGTVYLNQDGSPELDGLGQPVPTYTQADIREYARALTGWTYPTPPGAPTGQLNWSFLPGTMEARPVYHDPSAKALLRGDTLVAGGSPATDLDGVIANILAHPNLPPFIATRLIRSLVTSNPSPDYIQRVADVFAGYAPAPGYPLAPRGDLKATLAAVLLDPEARRDDPDPAQGHLKDPLSHVVGLARALDAQLTDPGMFMYLLGYMGERVLDSPTVFSYYSPLTPLPGDKTLYGPEFQIYSPAQALQRADFIYNLLRNQYGAGNHFDLTPLEAVANDPNALLDAINNRLFQGRMSPALRESLYTVSIAHSDPQQRALITLYLAALSGEYAVAR